MGRTVATLALLFVFTPACVGQEVVVGNAGDIIRVKSTFKGEVDWIVPDELDSPTRHYKNLAAKELIVVPRDGGQYQIYAISAEAGKPLMQRFIVVAKGTVPPVPPGPGPAPPPDTLASKIKTAYDLDVAAGEGGDSERKTVAAAFAQFGQFLPLLSKTDEVKKVIEVAAAGVLKGKLPKTMAVVYAHVAATVPEFNQAVPLTPELRATFGTVFTEISVALNLGPMPPPGPPGQRTVVIIRETADSTPELARMIVSLRAGTQAKYLADKGHPLLILDDDAVDQAGKPAAIVEKLRPHFKDIKLPALLILDGERVVNNEPLPPTADAVIEAVKKAGG